MRNTVPLTLIIPTMNRPEALERTLNTYVSGQVVPTQIIVVDQTQQECIRQKIEKLTERYGGEYVYQGIPSLTAARNHGIEKAINDIIIMSDDDVDVYEVTVSKTYEIMQRRETALVAGLDDNAGTSYTNIGYILGTKSYRKRKIGHVTRSVLGRYPDRISGEIETEWAMGYYFSIKKSLLNQWNIKWDERLISYAYAEDLDFSWRYCKEAHSMNYHCVLSDQIRVKHMVSHEYRIPSFKSTCMYTIHRRYIAHKNKCGSCIAIMWCDFWRLLERIVKHETPADFLKAIFIARKLARNEYTGMEDFLKTV